MKLLAAFYTNNRVRPRLLEESLRHFITAAENGPVIPVVSSWNPMPNLPCRNLVSHFRLEGHGHLNILLQLLQIVQSTDDRWDYFAFCEHDCLYPPRYFAETARRVSETLPRGLASENHLGLFPNGFAKWSFPFHPLFAMALRRDYLLEWLQGKLGQCASTGWCCLEPDDRTAWLTRSFGDGTAPIIHVNMNRTANNHHLTNIYDFYCIEDAEQHDRFWGNSAHFGVFTVTERQALFKPSISEDLYRIVDATYGDFNTDRLVTYLPALERKGFRGLFRVSNKEAKSDPAPGVVKTLRLKVVAECSNKAQTYEFKEGSLFCL